MYLSIGGFAKRWFQSDIFSGVIAFASVYLGKVAMMSKGSGPDIELGERIRQARKRAGLTSTALAKLVGVTQGTISLYENGKSGISVEVMWRIAAATATDIAELSGGAPNSSYIAVPAGPGILGADPKRWPSFMQGEAPVFWPGTLKSFVGSAAADVAQLGPDEVPMLAKVAVEMGPPLSDEGWMSLLAIMRTVTGGRGRPALHKVVPAEPEQRLRM